MAPASELTTSTNCIIQEI